MKINGDHEFKTLNRHLATKQDLLPVSRNYGTGRSLCSLTLACADCLLCMLTVYSPLYTALFFCGKRDVSFFFSTTQSSVY